MWFKKASKLVLVNFGVFFLLLVFAELASRGYEAIFPGSQYQYRLQQQAGSEVSSCVTPPIVTDSGDLSKYSEDFSCDGVTIKNGLRLTVDVPTAPSKTIHVFGGSTVFGTGAKDHETIPSYIQNFLNRNGVDVAVKNHGFMTLVASQQVAALKAADLKKGDVVLFYDGGNDAFNSFVYGSPEGTIIGYNRSNKLAFALVKTRHYLQLKSALYRAMGGLKASLAGTKDTPSSLDCSKNPDLSKQTYYINHYFDVLAEAKSYSESKGAEFVHVFQPILGSSNGLSADERDRTMKLLGVDGINWCTQENLLEYYQKLGASYDQFLNRINGHNLSTVFANDRSPFYDRYIDWIHMSPFANKLISDKLLNYIVSSTSLGNI